MKFEFETVSLDDIPASRNNNLERYIEGLMAVSRGDVEAGRFVCADKHEATRLSSSIGSYVKHHALPVVTLLRGSTVYLRRSDGA